MATAKSKIKKRYVVTGPYVTCKTMTHEGPRILGLYAGAPVPDDASDEWISHHLISNLIAEAPPLPAEEDAGEDKGDAGKEADSGSAAADAKGA